MGPGNLPVIWVRTTIMSWFSSRPIQKPDQLLLGGPTPDPYPLTCRFYCIWLDPSGPISGSALKVVLFMVTFRYPTVNCKILRMVHHCLFWIYRPPLQSKRGEIHTLPYPGNERQWSINDFLSCTLVNLSGDWLQPVINGVLATSRGKRGSNTLPAPAWKWVSTEHEQFLVSRLR